jgi:hypothetical protein
MPFYRTEGQGDNAVFPKRAQPVQKSKTRKSEYIALDKKELIAMCDERGIQSAKGTQVGRNQKKAYYIKRLLDFDIIHPAFDES